MQDDEARLGASSTSRSTRAAARETSRPTTHANPTYVVHDVVHYCVTNMPGAVARTSTFALNNATLPFVLALADKGIAAALRSDPHLLAGLNVTTARSRIPPWRPRSASTTRNRLAPSAGDGSGNAGKGLIAKENAGREARPGGRDSRDLFKLPTDGNAPSP